MSLLKSVFLQIGYWIRHHLADFSWLLIYCGLAIIWWWPLPLHIGNGQLEWPVVDAAFNQWIIAWGNHTLTSHPSQFFNANMFYPFRQTLAWGDQLFSITLFAIPLIPIFGLIGAYNVLLIGGSAASAFSIYLLVKYLAKNGYAGAIAGIFWGFSFYRFVEAGHIQILWTIWIPPVFLYAEKLRREKPVAVNLLLFILFSFLFLATNLYLDLFTLISFAIYWLTLVLSGQMRLRTVWRLLTGWLVSGGLALPIFWPSILIQLKNPLKRDLIGQLSLNARDLISWPINGQYLRHLFGLVGQPQVFGSFGLLTLPIVLIGFFVWLGRKDKNRADLSLYLAFAVILVVATLSSFGPKIVWGEQIIVARNPFFFSWYNNIPGYSALRVPERWFILSSFSLAVLLGWSLEAIWRSWRPLWQLVAAVLLALWFFAEQCPAPIFVHASYNFNDFPIYQWLAKQPGDFAILEMPIYPGRGVHQNDIIEAKRMLLSTLHWKNRVSGAISPDVPDAYVDNARILAKLGQDPKALQLLRDWKVKYVLFFPGDYVTLHWGLGVAGAEENYLNQTSGLKKIRTFGDEIVYQVEPAK